MQSAHHTELHCKICKVALGGKACLDGLCSPPIEIHPFLKVPIKWHFLSKGKSVSQSEYNSFLIILAAFCSFLFITKGITLFYLYSNEWF